MNAIVRGVLRGAVLCGLAALFVVVVIPELLFARNINEYKDTISDSAPSRGSNHTLSFVLNTTVAAGGSIEVVPPDGFETLSASTFAAERNVELSVNGVKRTVGVVQSGTNDFVEITPGTPGMIRYTLNTTAGITSGSNLVLKIGNHTTASNQFSEVYDEDTFSTTTTEADIKPIVNSAALGTHEVNVRVYNGGEVANAGFLIALVDQVGVGPVDTTEVIPPLRFNGAPTGTLSGTTLSVELSLETDEFALCRYSRTAGVAYNAMTNLFTNTGLIFHSVVVAVTPNSLQTFYVRCIDDEDNANTDDYLVTFSVNAQPTGSSNTEGDVSGDGTGSGNDGTGSGGGSGGTSGSSDGVAPAAGGSTGGGGSGGGSGGGAGGGRGAEGGGGFEGTDEPYRSGDAEVTITGYTAPRSQVTVLVDGKIAKTVTSGASGEYSVLIEAIARGAYTFGIYSTDSAKKKSSTFSTSFTVIGARASALSNIILAPSITATPDPVNPGQLLTLSGFAIPNATISLENEKEGSAASRKLLSTQSNASGAWTLAVDTAAFTTGTYKVRAKAAQAAGIASNFSNYTLYGVGQSAARPLNSDLNRDGKVNLVDFSILLFWWNTAGGDSDPAADINSDAKVNLTDFSILLFNWTG